MRPAGRFVLRYFEELVAGAALVVVIGSVCWGVLTRYVTAQPAAWASEVAVIAFAWLTFFGAAAGFRHGAHPTIDMLVRFLPAPWPTLVRWLNHLLIVGFCGFMIWYGTKFSIDALDNPTSVLRLPLTVLYGPVTIAFALMLVRYVAAARHAATTGERVAERLTP